MTYLWLILNVTDAILTILIIRNGGIEVMPVARYLIGINELVFAVLKVAGAIGIYYLLKRLWLKNHPDTLRVANGVFLAIVAINGASLFIVSLSNYL